MLEHWDLKNAVNLMDHVSLSGCFWLAMSNHISTLHIINQALNNDYKTRLTSHWKVGHDISLTMEEHNGIIHAVEAWW